MTAPPGIVIAAAGSGSGKTVVTMALLRLARHAGKAVQPVKVGPDYIDPSYLGAAAGRECINLDTWAMRPETLAAAVTHAGDGADLLVAEGVMGLFDGGPAGGSTADLAVTMDWPIVLVVDTAGMAGSAAALVHGFASYRPDVRLAGVLFNRVAGARHASLLRDACAGLDVPILGLVGRSETLALPSRHLGLVQAMEHEHLQAFIDEAATRLAADADWRGLLELAQPGRPLTRAEAAAPIPPLGQRVALARDEAFDFSYPHVVSAWQRAGATVLPFSPLADDAPDRDADAVFLPGGYPELHAGRLAGNERFLSGLRRAALKGMPVYGECGGYMVLGRGLVDAEGNRHAMAGLLPVETSFAEPRMRLGYREVKLLGPGPLGMGGSRFRGHEFHFARALSEPAHDVLFEVEDARGTRLGTAGGRVGHVFGSFIHLVDRTDGT